MKPSELHELAKTKLAHYQAQVEIEDYDRKVLSKTGPAIFVCNSISPDIDEWVLLYVMSEFNPMSRILHPYPIKTWGDWSEWAVSAQRGQLANRFLQPDFAKKAQKYIKNGASLGLAIEFSDNILGNTGRNLLRQPIMKQLRKCNAPIVPVHLSADRLPAGFLRKTLQGLPLPFLSAEPVHINVRIGTPIQADDIEKFERTRLFAKFLQARIFSLGSPYHLDPEHFTTAPPIEDLPLAEPIAREKLLMDIQALKPEHTIASRGQFDVFVAPFHALPHVMFEVGRLREMTFRSVGEGTGKPRDMDEYDLYYLHLIIWDREAQQIVGGYRLGQGDVIFKRFGINGFYTNSLFKMKKEFYPVLQQAVELGRSYVTPEYQKHRLPLFLLWKGILYFLLANPRYRYLYGPVSISKEYTDVSKSVIVEFVKRFCYDEKLARLVRPRKPFRVKTKDVDTRLLAESLHGEFDALEAFVEAVEPEHFKIPVLFRQYLKQNAKFIAFNVDPLFNDCLDGLMILDIHHLPASTIEALQQEK